MNRDQFNELVRLGQDPAYNHAMRRAGTATAATSDEFRQARENLGAKPFEGRATVAKRRIRTPDFASPRRKKDDDLS